MIRCKPFFANDCERTEVWSAFCERSYGGIGELCVENMGGIIRQGSVRSTKKNGDEQKNYSFFIIEYSTSPREEACERIMYEGVTLFLFP